MPKSELPLLDFAESLSPQLNFSKTLLVTCQHILKGNVVLLDRLLERGLKPENVFWLGKVYSTSQQAASELQERGIFVHPTGFSYNPHQAFDEQHAEAASSILKMALKQEPESERVLLVDEGGELIFQANRQEKNLTKIRAVEWTSSGHDKLFQENIAFPVVNMARSRLKLEFEAPIIAAHAIGKLREAFFNYKKDSPKILVVGGGSIGANIASLLRKDYQVQLYDIVTSRSDFNEKTLQNLLQEYDVIVGATGKTIMHFDDLKYLQPNSILASCSSSDREFSASDLRKESASSNNPHLDLAIQNIHLLNSGFPVTFDGSPSPVPLEKIQVTYALAYASISQAMSLTSDKGLVDVDPLLQQKIIDKLVSI